MADARSVGNPSFIAYVDESGDEGFRFGKGSSDWFVISAVVTRYATDLATVKLVDVVRNQLGKPPKIPLHFRDLRHEHRLPFVDLVAKADLRAITVLTHKPSLKEPEKFQERNRLYFYATRYLLERLSWYCRDNRPSHDAGDGSVEIVFSNRSGMSYDEMREYFSHLRDNTGYIDVRIDWSAVKPEQIRSATAGKYMGLQVADAVASSLYYAVQPSQYGFTEDRYARTLKPVTYYRSAKYVGYGLKFWPGEIEQQIRSHPHLAWVSHFEK